MKDDPKVEVIESTLIFPAEKQNETTVALSILDATVAHFAPCAAVWYFDAPSEESGGSNWPSDLQESLRVILSTFPQFAGDLKKVKHVPGGDHTQRYGRLQLTFGAATDPGVGFSIARCPLSLDELVPSPAQRKAPELHCWNLSCSATCFLSEFPMSPPSVVLGSQNTVPSIIAHPLADAHALAIFMHRWSYEHSLIFVDAPTITPSSSFSFSDNSQPPTFNPQLLDACAAGDIDAAFPVDTILEKSRSLPSSRYDWFWPPPDGDPDQHLPPGLTRSMVISPGNQMPKADWDRTARVSHTKLHFSAAHIQRFWEAAGPSVSRHDAILAHVWSAVNRARGLSTDDQDVSLHISFGVRRRLGLPSSFMGSPILNTSVKMAGKDVSGFAARDVADKIHGTVALYTEDALKARLHDLCFECAPQRFGRHIWAPDMCYLQAGHIYICMRLSLEGVTGNLDTLSLLCR
ncbi:hypothetical protein BDW59DRAFT_155723 [Aspergillus cavernicola]|uniref:Transferase family-domain-containing protein n=1 Tax=Aspergillus cavernicola TaxID=176166 RepID=A0ABR4J4C7_9EURO